MKKSKFKVLAFAVIALIGSAIFIACGKDTTAIKSGEMDRQQDSLKTRIDHLKSVFNTKIALLEFDAAEFSSYGIKEWQRFPEKHSENIKVTWPDGHQTFGREKYFEELKSLFAHAPDTKIIEHPMQLGSAKKTAVTGTMTGTFTEPLVTENGKSTKPTGKSFFIPIYAVGIWENGQMVEELLYWDDQQYKTQLGIKR